MKEIIFEKNLKAMEKWYPDFADMIRNEKYDMDDTKVRVEQSWDGEKIFRIETGERRLYLGGKRNAAEPVEMVGRYSQIRSGIFVRYWQRSIFEVSHTSFAKGSKRCSVRTLYGCLFNRFERN